jgi:peptidyl-prolyl cis-trans isomerase C
MEHLASLFSLAYRYAYMRQLGFAVAVAVFLWNGPLPAERAHVVCAVGGRSLTVGEVEDRWSPLPAFQQALFGATPAAARLGFVNDVLVPELLYAAEADARSLSRRPAAVFELQRARSSATLRAVRQRLGGPETILAADVQRYYDEHASLFHAPERVALWRILCPSRQEAMDVLEQVQRAPVPKTFTDLARERSMDKATHLRSGSLGFVALDGTSNQPGLHVDPAVVRAALTVKDGELVPRVIAEGERFAVVWRRGTVAATHRTVDASAAQIRSTLWKQRVEGAEKALLDALRASKVTEVHAELLDNLVLPGPDAAILVPEVIRR